MLRRRTLSAAVRRDTLRADVLEMRLRMRRELSRSGAGQFDIKQDAGGIADIEFLVQYWVLAAAQAQPARRRSSAIYADTRSAARDLARDL